MLMDSTGRYWFDVWHAGPAGWCVRFKPVAFDSVAEERWGFSHAHEAARCLRLLASEHCVEYDVECEGR